MYTFNMQVRELHARLLLASANSELSEEFKLQTRAQLLQIATTLEPANV